MNYYLGIDIGTTSAKAVAFSETGEVIGSFSTAYEMCHPEPNRSEQDPDEILAAVVLGINQVLKEFAPHNPSFISFSAAMHSLIAVDVKGRLLTQCIIWADNRANEVAEKLRSSREGVGFYHSTGVPIHAMSPLCKLIWLKENRAEIFNAAFKFIGIKEYIFYKLFGTFAVDSSIASATGLLNIRTLQWDEDVIKFLGVRLSQLPEVVQTKTLFYYKGIYQGLVLSEAVPVVIGASDGALSNLGSGADNDTSMAVTIGTSGAARLIVSAPETDSAMRSFCYHLKDELYIAGGANNNGAVVLQWLKDSLLNSSEDYEDLFKVARTASPGCDGLLLLPYLLGERAPLWNSNAKGVFFGLGIQHTKAHLVRACMEGVIFSIYSIVKILAEKRKVLEILASGGFAKSALWLQMLADVARLKVVVSDSVESSALGAVMLGAEAVGIHTRFTKSTLATYFPDAENAAVYTRQFEKFQRLYDLLKGEMVNENKLPK
ncbi:MAG TPA: gluconokinase [Segetibacter sp.]|jgi:gluconokinase